MKIHRILPAALAVALPGLAHADEVPLPDRMTWASYDSQSIVYAESIAIGKVLETHYGTKLQAIPIRNGFSRMLPLFSGKADIVTTGSDGYFAQEGAFIFAKQGYGPQRLRIIAYNETNPGNGAAVTADSGIKTWADAKGKRVAVVQGSAAPAKVVEASLAFAGLTWDDVVRVPVSSWSAGQEALINGQADIAAANTTSPSVERLANSPRGIHWPATSHDDTEGWARLNAVAPYIQQAEICQGIGIPEGECVQINGYGYPEYLALPDLDEDTVYGLVKAMDIHSDEIATAFPRAKGYAFANQRMQQAWPWHDGAIRYFKEKGVWDDAAQAHHEMLLTRQDVLAAAWDEMTTGDVPGDEAEFAAKWSDIRARHLREAELPVVYDDVWNY